jgi:putative ABC transport system permease protein
MIRAGAQALWSHWARHRVQLLVVIIGLALATGLWTGVQAINAEARASYDRAASALGQDQLEQIARTDGPLRLADFAVLRRAGWLVTPVVQGGLRGTGLEVLGFDPFTAPPGPTVPNLAGEDGDLTAFLVPPGLIFVHPDTLARLPEGLPPARVLDTVAPGRIVTDLAVAQRLLRSDTLSALLVLAGQPEGRVPLADLDAGLALRAPAEGGSEIARLTDSFHLNLTAFGLLSFAVGLFIVHAAIGLAFEQRRVLFRTLRALGLPQRALVGLLAAEAFVLATVGGLLGILLGYAVAAALLPGVAATLSGLYGAGVAGSLSLDPVWWLTGFVMAYVGAAAAAGSSLWQLARLPILAPAMPRAWALANAGAARVQALGGLVLLVASGALALLGDGLLAGFACLAALLLGAALLVPFALALILTGLSRFGSGALIRWIWADTRQQIPALSLALMALLLALAANVGVSTMVGSFRGTFIGWLDQRLASELYITTRSPAEAAAFADFVRGDVAAILPIVSADITLGGAPGEVFGIADHPTYRDHWPLLEGTSDVWNRVAAGTGVLVNEQLARRDGLWTGDAVALAPDWEMEIAGVYSDYGNTAGQAIVGLASFNARFPDITPVRFALRTDTPAALRDRIVIDFGLPLENTINQEEVKAFSMQVFEQTFLVTRALNVLTLGVAGFALWASLTTVASMRLPQIAPVWALGLTRRHLAALEMGRALALATLTAVLAVPVGLLLAWVLLAIVNVEAFGWRLPMQVFPWDWAQLLVWALVGAALAAALPMRRIAKLPPAELLKVFAHAR